MSETMSPDYFTLFETSLVKFHFLSATFKEISGGKELKVNRKRLLAIVFNVIMISRYLLSIIFNNVYLDLMLGDVLWSLGVAGYFSKCFAILVALLAFTYLTTIWHCENREQLDILYDLHPNSQDMFYESDYPRLLVSKQFKLIYKMNIIFRYVVPYGLSAICYGAASWQAFQLKPSLGQLVYNLVWSSITCIWIGKFLTALYSIGLLIYLIAKKVNSDFKALRLALTECRSIVMLIKALTLHSTLLVKLDRYNGFVKFIVGWTTFLSIPAVSIVLSIFSVEHNNIIFKYFVTFAGICIALLMVATAAFTSSTFHQSRSLYSKLNSLIAENFGNQSLRWHIFKTIKVIGSDRKPVSFYCFDLYPYNYDSFYDYICQTAIMFIMFMGFVR